MTLPVTQHTGEATGRSIELPEEVFCITPHTHAIYLDVKHILANRRQGTHKTKERGEVTGSTRKLRKQKGSGSARVGSIKSPLFRGGGSIFGPRPRSYEFKLNKKIKKLARKSALSEKLKQNAFTVLADFSFSSPKTKQYQTMLDQLNLLDVKTLLILSAHNQNIILSGRNLKNVTVLLADQINTYDLLHAKHVLVSEPAIASITENLKGV